MCVIIYVPKEASISDKELKDAWDTNPDGAGFSIQKDNKVIFERGFMNFKDYLNKIKPLIGIYNLILHFRISTSKKINKVQTHPYKKGNVTLTKGETDKPVICMNGIISNQKEYKDCNDTMSYIVDHDEAFTNINQDVLNIIEEATGAKWAVMTPDNVLLSSKFIKQDGKYYSNKNHLYKRYFTESYYIVPKRKKAFNNMIKTKSLRKAIRKDKALYNDVIDFIDIWCDSDSYCTFCTKCLKTARSIRDVKITLDENYDCNNLWKEDNEEVIYNDKCTLDYLYNDYYDYNNLWDENSCEVNYNIFDE